MGKNIYLFICVFSLSVIFACKKQQEIQPVPPTVTVAPALMGTITQSYEIIGQAYANKQVELLARVRGFLEKRNFQEGRHVQKDQLLFAIEKTDYEAAVKIAQASLKRAKAELVLSNVEYNRQKTLLSENATAKRNFDIAESNKLKAEADLMNAEAQLAQAQLNLSYTEVKAPFDGIIGFTTYDVGNVVGPTSQPLATVVNIDPIDVRFNISEIDLLQIREEINRMQSDNKIKLSDEKIKEKIFKHIDIYLNFQDGKRYQHKGYINAASNIVNPSTGTLLIEASFPNKDELISVGMYVKILIEQKQSGKTLLVPKAGVISSQAGEYVLLVDDNNKVNRRYVTTGVRSGTDVEILKGLEEDDKIIIDGIQKVRPNITVKAILDENYSQGTVDKTQKSENDKK